VISISGISIYKMKNLNSEKLSLSSFFVPLLKIVVNFVNYTSYDNALRHSHNLPSTVKEDALSGSKIRPGRASNH
jgi:hypothetical protein